MKTGIIFRILSVVALLSGGWAAARGDNSFYLATTYIEPDASGNLTFNLDNDEPFYGFQMDIMVPEGIEVVTADGKPTATLSDRADASYSLLSRMDADGKLRVACFSTTHTPFSGNEGALLNVPVVAAADFEGGTVTVTDIIFITEQNQDAEFPAISAELRNQPLNTLTIADFSIEVGATEQVACSLENEVTFTAFQTDIYFPEELTLVENSLCLTDRASASHTLSAKSFEGGRTRVICHSLVNADISGSNGPLLEFEVTAADDTEAVSAVISLRNTVCSTSTGREYSLPPSEARVIITRRPVILAESVAITPDVCTLTLGDSIQLEVRVLPEDCTNPEATWASSDPDIAAVDSTGLVKTYAVGEVLITATTTDGTELTAECEMEVKLDVGVDSLPSEETGAVELYDLNGIRRTGPAERGIYIRRTRSGSSKQLATTNLH